VGEERLHYELVRELLDIEQRHRAQARRAGLFESLDKALKRGFYVDEADATARAHQHRAAFNRAAKGPDPEPDPLDLADGYIRPVHREVTG
jgi:DNA sulfur modification protein DndC